MEERILICMPYYSGGAQGRELEMSLTGWKKFCKFPFKIAIIGDNNPIMNKFDFVEWVPCERVPIAENQYRPHLDRANKFLKAYELYHNGEHYDGFFHICDDHYPVHDFDLKYLTQHYYLQMDFNGDMSKAPNNWKHDLAKTKQLLKRKGLHSVNFTTHFPQWYDFEKYKKIVDEFNLTKNSYVIENIYYNYYNVRLSQQADSIRLGVWNATDSNEKMDSILSNPNDKRKFIACSTAGYNKNFENKLCKYLGI